MDARMNQRGIPAALVDLVLEHGRWRGDACMLDRKGLRRLLDDVDGFRSTVVKALDKGGVAVVEAGGALLTTYARPGEHRPRGRRQ
jgi:hypothetical protein